MRPRLDRPRAPAVALRSADHARSLRNRPPDPAHAPSRPARGLLHGPARGGARVRARRDPDRSPDRGHRCRRERPSDDRGDRHRPQHRSRPPRPGGTGAAGRDVRAALRTSRTTPERRTAGRADRDAAHAMNDGGPRSRRAPRGRPGPPSPLRIDDARRLTVPPTFRARPGGPGARFPTRRPRRPSNRVPGRRITAGGSGRAGGRLSAAAGTAGGMDEAAARELYRRWLPGMWEAPTEELDRIAREVFTDDVVGHWPGRDVHGPTAVADQIRTTHAMFTRIRTTVQVGPVIGADGLVAAHWLFTADYV